MNVYAIVIWGLSLCLGLLSFSLKAETSALNKVTKERILFLNSYPIGERGKKIADGFKQTILRKYPNSEFYFESMEYRKLEKAFQSFDGKIADSYSSVVANERKRLHQLILSYKPSLLVLSDDEVGEVVHPLPEKFHGPVFFMGMNRKLKDTPWYQSNPARYVGGISDNLPVRRSVEVLRDLVPLKKVALVSSKGMTSNLLIQYMSEELNKVGVKVESVIESGSWKEWQEKLLEVQSKVDLIWMLIPYQVYENNKEVKLAKMGAWMTENLSVPTAGVSDVNVKMGIWFAQASDSHAIGAQLGDQVVSYLNSGKSQSMGIEPRLSYDFIMNSQTAKKLKIKVPEKLMGFIRMIYNEDILEKKGTI